MGRVNDEPVNDRFSAASKGKCQPALLDDDEKGEDYSHGTIAYICWNACSNIRAQMYDCTLQTSEVGLVHTSE